jgi:hypothetical protein
MMLSMFGPLAKSMTRLARFPGGQRRLIVAHGIVSYWGISRQRPSVDRCVQCKHSGNPIHEKLRISDEIFYHRFAGVGRCCYTTFLAFEPASRLPVWLNHEPVKNLMRITQFLMGAFCARR